MSEIMAPRGHLWMVESVSAALQPSHNHRADSLSYPHGHVSEASLEAEVIRWIEML